MNSKKSLTLVLLILTAALILPSYIPITSAQPPGLIPTNPAFIHLDMEPPVFPPVPANVCTQWHEIYPTYCNEYHLCYIQDTNLNERADVSEKVVLHNKVTSQRSWYHVEWVTVTIKVENVTGASREVMYLEFDGTLADWMTTYQYVPISTWWHEIYPAFSLMRHITSWDDTNKTGPNLNVLGPSDMIDFEDLPGQFWHVLALKTDLIVSEIEPAATCGLTSTGTYFEVVPRNNIYETPCNTFTVDIDINNGVNVYALGASLYFNQSVLEITNIQIGPFLTDPKICANTSQAAANAQGWVRIECSRIGAVGGVTGSGTVANVTFHVKADGRSKLDLQDTITIDTNLVTTAHPNNDGFFCSTAAFTCLHDIEILDVKVSATDVLQGAIVNINVTIHNDGNHVQNVTVYAYADQIVYAADPDFLAVGDEIVIGSQTVLNISPCNIVSVIIPWNTALVPGEAWTISAQAVKIDGNADNDPNDNVYIDDTVLITCPHDLKVTDVSVLTPKVSIDPVLVIGRNASISVSIHNEGQNPETFTVDVYAKTILTPEESGYSILHIANYTVVNLPVCNTDTRIVKWITSAVMPMECKLYYIYVWVTPVAGEKDVCDNLCCGDKPIYTQYHDVHVKPCTMGVGGAENTYLWDCCEHWGNVARITTTIGNDGCIREVTITYICYDYTNPGGSLLGVILGVWLDQGVQMTFNWIAPYGGIPTGAFPANTTVPIYAVISISPVDELNKANNVQLVGYLTILCYADVNNDCVVSVLDLILVLVHLGPCTPPNCCSAPVTGNDCPTLGNSADVNNDNVVSVLDLILVLTHLGPCAC